MLFEGKHPWWRFKMWWRDIAQTYRIRATVEWRVHKIKFIIVIAALIFWVGFWAGYNWNITEFRIYVEIK